MSKDIVEKHLGGALNVSNKAIIVEGKEYTGLVSGSRCLKSKVL